MRKFRGRNFILILLVFLLVCGFSFKLKAAESSPLKVFQEVLFLINNYHVEEHKIEELIEGAIKGMVDTLDPFSEYMTPDEYDEMQVEFEGHFGGIGIVITPDLTIVSPIKGTPGDKAGLKPGDKIIAIDGKPTEDMDWQKAVDLMRGEPGTSVDLTIKREKEKEPLEFHIIRSDIEVPYVESEMKTDEIGYVVISQFVQDVGHKVREALVDLKSRGARAIILDLRSNPGGLLSEAITVASNFIAEGRIVSVKQRYGQDEVFKVDPTIEAVDLPLAVLINQGSASASEIVAGAIQDYNRGKLIGMKTFGKGTVQSVIPLSDGSALRLTTGKYYTPTGRFIHEKGIKPDIEIEFDPDYEGDNQLEEAIDYLESVLLSREVLKNAS